MKSPLRLVLRTQRPSVLAERLRVCDPVNQPLAVAPQGSRDVLAAGYVNSIARQIEAAVAADLRWLSAVLGEGFVVQALQHVVVPGTRERVWERGWAVVSSAGRTLRVGVRARVADPQIVTITLDGRAVWSGTSGSADTTSLARSVRSAISSSAAWMRAQSQTRDAMSITGIALIPTARRS